MPFKFGHEIEWKKILKINILYSAIIFILLVLLTLAKIMEYAHQQDIHFCFSFNLVVNKILTEKMENICLIAENFGSLKYSLNQLDLIF